MASRYVCSQCLHDINHIFALPPLQPVSTCRNCGYRMRRCLISMAQAWMGFFGLWSFLLIWAAFSIMGLLNFQGVAHLVGWVIGSAIGAAIIAVGVALVGYVVGLIVGLLVNANWGSPTITGGKLMEMAHAAVANAPPDPRLRVSLDLPQQHHRPRVVARRCWHCGHGFEASTAAGTKVQCPSCAANLGFANPNDLLD